MTGYSLIKRRKFADGGDVDSQPPPKHPLFNNNRTAYVDSVLNANKNLDWVKRLHGAGNPTLQVKGQPDLSTHFMADDGNGYVYPTVVRLPNQKNLTFEGKYLGEDKNGNPQYDTDPAYNYAKNTGTGIQLPKQQGTWFADNGYKTGTGVLNSINGTPYNNPNYGKPNLGLPDLSNPTMQQDNTKVVPQYSEGGNIMTGYSKIKRTKLRRYAGGGQLGPDGYPIVDNSENQNGQHDNDSQSSGNQSSSNFFQGNSKAITTGANFLGDAVSSFNNGGTGQGSVALGAVSSTLKGAAAGTAVLPGIGTIVGAGIGLATGIVGGEKKRTQLLQQQATQRNQRATLAQQQSNQVLQQYDNNGVENAQLYRRGGRIFASGGEPPVMYPKLNLPSTSINFGNDSNLPSYNNSVNKLVSSNPSWGKPTFAGGNAVNGYRWNLGTPPDPDTVPRSTYNPTSFQSSIPGRNMPNNPKGQDVEYHSNYASGGDLRNIKRLNTNYDLPNFPLYSSGGSIHIKPSHKGRFTAYKERTGKTTEEALHSKDPHVRQMANFARNASHFKHRLGGSIEQFDTGGDIQPDLYEAEGGETVQGDANMEQATPLASDMQQINGPSHEQGGVMGQGGDRIFSDRLKVSPNLLTTLKTNGIKVNGNSTYADVSNKLGKLKGKFEGKTDGVGKQTANVMLPRIAQSLDDTFNDQEMGKMEQQRKKFAKGGSPSGMKSNLDGMSYRATPNGMSILNVFDDGGDLTNLPNRNDNGYIDSGSTPMTGLTNPYAFPTNTVINSTVPNNYTAPPSTLSKVSDFVSNNSGQIANAGNYLANLGTINRLRTDVNPAYVSSPNYNYVDRSGSALSRNAALLKTGVRSLTNSGSTVNVANIGALFARTQEGNSVISANENARKDSYNNEFNQRADRINAENTGIYSKSIDDSRDLYNQKVGLQLGARNAFQQGIVGNQAVKNQSDLEQKKLLTILATNDQNGVMTRFLQNYSKYKKLLDTYNSNG